MGPMRRQVMLLPGRSFFVTTESPQQPRWGQPAVAAAIAVEVGRDGGGQAVAAAAMATDFFLPHEEEGPPQGCSGGDGSFSASGGSSSSTGGQEGSGADDLGPDAASLVEGLLRELRCHLVAAGIRLDNPDEAMFKAAWLLQRLETASKDPGTSAKQGSGSKEPSSVEPGPVIAANEGIGRRPVPSPDSEHLSRAARCCAPRVSFGSLLRRRRGASFPSDPLGPTVVQEEVPLEAERPDLEPVAEVPDNVQLDCKEWLKFCKVLKILPLQAEQLFIVLGGEELGSVDLWTMFSVLHATLPPEASEASPERFVCQLLQRFGSLKHAFRMYCSHPERGMIWSEFRALADVACMSENGAFIVWAILVSAEQYFHEESASPAELDALVRSVAEDVFVEQLSFCAVETDTDARHHETDQLCMRLDSVFAGAYATPRPTTAEELFCARNSTPLLWHQLHTLEAIPTPCRQWGTPFATPNGRGAASSRTPQKVLHRAEEVMDETSTLPQPAAGLQVVAEGQPGRRSSRSHPFTPLYQVLGTTRAIWRGAGTWMRKINGQPGFA
jgi:hypothetical protein